MDTNEKVRVVAKQEATRKTKNKIHNHGPVFTVIARQIFVGTGELYGRMCYLLHNDARGMVGWVPVDDVIIEEVDKQASGD